MAHAKTVDSCRLSAYSTHCSWEASPSLKKGLSEYLHICNRQVWILFQGPINGLLARSGMKGHSDCYVDIRSWRTKETY